MIALTTDLTDIAAAIGVRPDEITKPFASPFDAVEDAFLTTKLRAWSLDLDDEHTTRMADEAIRQSVQADRLRVMTLIKLRLQALAPQGRTDTQGTPQTSGAAASAAPAAQAMLGDFKQAHALFEQRLTEITSALSRGDLSGATFPRVGSEARIELSARQAELQWILEMLPNPNRA